ncbi:hypothetical protein tb265_18120 [Gemmatimonadetes bacterium T265]|nr:hypothetical protein tb265_18120 [Gemmatimonadetes bacterium T265]
MLPPVKPALDPLAQRAAIDALEAQRAAYQRYARTVDDQTRALGSGDPDGAVTAANTAARGFDELDAGAQTLRPHLDRVRAEGSPDQRFDVQRRLDTLTSDAQRAQTAIQNLTAQLDAWRVAYGRQLSSVGLTPGSAGTSAGDGGSAVGGVSRGPDAAANNGVGADPRARDGRGYGPRGQAGAGRPAPALLNRIG